MSLPLLSPVKDCLPEMSRRSNDQQPLKLTCPAIQSHEQMLGLMQETHVQASPPLLQQIRDFGAGTEHEGPERADRNSVPSDQNTVEFSVESHAHESDSDVSGSANSSPNRLHHATTTSELGLSHQTLSLTSLDHIQPHHTDPAASVTPSSSCPSPVSLNSELQCSRLLPISESLGLEGCFGIIGGFVGIIGVSGFLAFLWFGAGSAPEAANATWVWRQLAMRNWMPRAVTLTSIILRFIVGIQAVICTSMIAALLLERLSIPRSQAAYTSIMRGINNGPWKLVRLMLSHKANTLYFLRHFEAWLLLLLLFLSLALQFTSTILLSDMHSFTMIGDPNITKIVSLLAFPGYDKFSLLVGDLMATKPVYPIFGDASTTYYSDPDSRGFSDTGLKQRGLLPISNKDFRTSVREYDGTGIVMSSRVACMRPVIRNVSLTSIPVAYNDVAYGELQGVLDYSRGLQEARPGTGSSCSHSKKCEELAFRCLIPASNKATEWAAGGCAIDVVGGDTSISSQPTWDSADMPWSENSSVWLVYSTNMATEEWMSLPPSPSPPSSRPSDEWIIYEVAPGQIIKLSACFSAFNFANRAIRMVAAGATTESSKPFSMVLGADYNMYGVETYLGFNPSHQSVADRGILELQIKSDDTIYNDTLHTLQAPIDVLLSLPAEEISPSALTVASVEFETKFQLGNSNGNTTNLTFTLCTRCYIGAMTVNMEYASLFSSILLGESNSTGRAADALSALVTLAGFNVYNQFLAGTMDVAEQVRLVTSLVATVPGAWPLTIAQYTGFIAIASMLAAYLALILGITVLYIRKTRFSRYGNIWHVVSQLIASEELDEMLELGNNADDKAVLKGLQSNKLSKEDKRVKLLKVEGCEKIKIRRSGA